MRIRAVRGSGTFPPARCDAPLKYANMYRVRRCNLILMCKPFQVWYILQTFTINVRGYGPKLQASRLERPENIIVLGDNLGNHGPEDSTFLGNIIIRKVGDKIPTGELQVVTPRW
jgi:hypothetical protein